MGGQFEKILETLYEEARAFKYEEKQNRINDAKKEIRELVMGLDRKTIECSDCKYLANDKNAPGADCDKPEYEECPKAILVSDLKKALK